ncbi:hypothetical protein IJ798_01785 [Candidatus Saccharibacteria bacterium]|nr:hypothetical protein [Candidatus Saccharibacteria bacterium]
MKKLRLHGDTGRYSWRSSSSHFVSISGVPATTTGRTVRSSIVLRMATGGLVMLRRPRTLTTSIRTLVVLVATSMPRTATIGATAFRSVA